MDYVGFIWEHREILPHIVENKMEKIDNYIKIGNHFGLGLYCPLEDTGSAGGSSQSILLAAAC